MVDLTESLGWMINQVKSKLIPTQVFSFVGYEYHLNSALVKPTQERWQKLQALIFRITNQSSLTARHLMASQGELDISSVVGQAPSLVRLHHSSSGLEAESTKCSEGADLHPQEPQHSSVYRRLKRRLGRSLKSRFYQRTVVRSRKIIAHKRFRTKGSVLGPKDLRGDRSLLFIPFKKEPCLNNNSR